MSDNCIDVSHKKKLNASILKCALSVDTLQALIALKAYKDVQHLNVLCEKSVTFKNSDFLASIRGLETKIPITNII